MQEEAEYNEMIKEVRALSKGNIFRKFNKHAERVMAIVMQAVLD